MFFSSSARAFVISESSLTKGGAFYISGVNVSINTDKNTKIKGNKAIYGGVFYLGDNSQIDFHSPMSIQNNSASYGGVFSGSGDYTISGEGEVICSENNATDGNGGDFAYISGGTVNFGGNFSSSGGRGTNGGAMFITEANINFNGDLTLSDNNTTNTGGAIYCYNGNFSFNDECNITIKNNYSAVLGGGIYIEYGDFYCNGGSINISYNKCNSGGAGIAFQYTSNIKFYGGDMLITNNSNAIWGGGIGFWRCPTDILFSGTNITIKNNYTSDVGGGMHFDGQGFYMRVTFNSGTIMMSDNYNDSIYFYYMSAVNVASGFTIKNANGDTCGAQWNSCIYIRWYS